VFSGALPRVGALIRKQAPLASEKHVWAHKTVRCDAETTNVLSKYVLHVLPRQNFAYDFHESSLPILNSMSAQKEEEKTGIGILEEKTGILAEKTGILAMEY